MPIDRAPSPIVIKDPDDVIGLIQGQTPDSINEWYVSLALDRLRIPYMYQYSILGGRDFRGGQVIDFVCFTPLGSIPVFIQGAYWHSYRQDPEQTIKIAAARHVFNNEPVLLEEEETDTKEKAFAIVRQKLQV
jgi:hypothetical protein